MPEAEAPIRRALALNPLVPVSHFELSLWYAATGQGDSAYVAAQRMIALDTATVTLRVYGEALAGLVGRFADARRDYFAASTSVVSCGRLWGRAGAERDVRAARAFLDELSLRRPTATTIPVSTQAVFYAQRGVADSAFARLQRAVREKEPTTYGVLSLAALTPLQRDPRWAALVQECRGR